MLYFRRNHIKPKIPKGKPCFVREKLEVITKVKQDESQPIASHDEE